MLYGSKFMHCISSLCGPSYGIYPDVRFIIYSLYRSDMFCSLFDKRTPLPSKYCNCSESIIFFFLVQCNLIRNLSNGKDLIFFGVLKLCLFSILHRQQQSFILHFYDTLKNGSFYYSFKLEGRSGIPHILCMYNFRFDILLVSIMWYAFCVNAEHRNTLIS